MLVIFFPCWNDMDWMEAAIEQLEYWAPDKLYFCEGAWDTRFPAQSTDGTREFVEKYVKEHKNCWIIDNVRDGEYRQNQASTCSMVMRCAQVKPGDWVMYQACDFYLYKSDIDLYKQYIAEDAFDYPRFEIRNFWQCTTLYYPKWTNQALNLPWKFVKDAFWIPTCHLCVKGQQYHESPHVRQKTLPIAGYHYEGFRLPQRLEDKYAVGDRQSPIVWNGGEKLKDGNRVKYTGGHPEFVRKNLKEKVAEWNAGN